MTKRKTSQRCRYTRKTVENFECSKTEKKNWKRSMIWRHNHRWKYTKKKFFCSVIILCWMKRACALYIYNMGYIVHNNKFLCEKEINISSKQFALRSSTLQKNYTQKIVLCIYTSIFHESQQFLEDIIGTHAWHIQ